VPFARILVCNQGSGKIRTELSLEFVEDVPSSIASRQEFILVNPTKKFLLTTVLFLLVFVTGWVTLTDRLVAQDSTSSDHRHWAWQPVRSSSAHGHHAWDEFRGHPIDAFLQQRQQAANLNMSAEADRRTLIRRLTFDLWGLPPSPEQVNKFLEDQDSRAYESLVDRLLDSPHYGERWARHWLDIAHYADTHGFERDQRRDHAWRYRDWVIRALNADMSYDQFLKDQIAGDVLRPEDPDAVIATGFLSAGPWDFVGQAETRSEVLKRAARADDLDDLVTQVMTAACAVTVNCARCHDHKLDPIPQRDYYALWAVFSAVKRGDRDVSPAQVRDLAQQTQNLEAELQMVREELATRMGKLIHLADIVGGGNGRGSGKPGNGIDPVTGNLQIAKRGTLEGVTPNQFVKSAVRFVDGVVIPDASDLGTQVSSTGLRVQNVPKTSGQAWDAIRFGPVNSQFSTTLGETNFAADGHSLLSLHANSAITFDLKALRDTGLPQEMMFSTMAGYFGQTAKEGASFAIYLDGQLIHQRTGIGRDDGIIPIEFPIPPDAKFLTLMATDSGNGIGHDQICFADPWLISGGPVSASDVEQQEIARLKNRQREIAAALSSIPAASRVYAVVTDPTGQPMKILQRGDPEQPAEEVLPGTLTCIDELKPELGTNESTDAQRRIAFANWVTATENPLTRRVIVNRLWHYHFGVGLVDTPSDFGSGGSLPSHPELLDWLADELLTNHWSLKSIHRLICTSAAYRQRSEIGSDTNSERGMKVDAGNRLLWRINSRRLDAESVRDAVLSVSGKLNLEMYGPGYRDFEYKEEYAPVYRYITADQPDLWRRSIYRFIVRTTAHQFLTTLDCPSPANLVPTRNVTTTALQSLTLLNNPFMLKQSEYFARRVESESELEDRPRRAFQLAFGRNPSPAEAASAAELVKSRGLTQLCRMLLNANEFVYVD
jgi:hypothetical protein